MTEEIERTSESVEVEWRGGMDNMQTVRGDPYTGKITVNGREFAIGTLCSQDVPDWMYRSQPEASGYTGSDHDDDVR